MGPLLVLLLLLLMNGKERGWKEGRAVAGGEEAEPGSNTYIRFPGPCPRAT